MGVSSMTKRSGQVAITMFADQEYRIGPSPCGVRASTREGEHGIELKVTVLVKTVGGGAGEILFRGDFDSMAQAQLFAMQWVGWGGWQKAPEGRVIDPYFAYGRL